MLDKNREACDCPIDCQVSNTVKVQKRMKSIARLVHLSSVIQSEFYEATRIIFVRKENKNKTFSINNSSPLCPRQRSAILDITQRTHAAYALLSAST